MASGLKLSKPVSRMHPIHWIPDGATSLLDVGCNAGDLLFDCRKIFLHIELAGIDINNSAVQAAKKRLPGAEIRQGFGYQLPFADQRFDCVTCIEVIEHVPALQRPLLLAEMRRVLVPGGRLVLRCPHAGIFSWLDPQNFRFRVPRLYRLVVRDGKRDPHYRESQEELVWHHHFTRGELLLAAGDGWELEACEFGGLVLLPLSDILRWPFYRTNRVDSPIAHALERMGRFELDLSFGTSSYDILLSLKKTPASA